MTNIYDTSILPYNGYDNTYMESFEIDSWNKFVDVAMESVGMDDNIEIKDFLYKYADSVVYEKAINPNSEISKLLKEAKNEYKTNLKKARKAIKTGDRATAHKEINNAISALMKAQKSSEKIMKEDSTSFNSAMGFVVVTLIDCAKLFLVTLATGGIGTVFVAGYQAIKDIVAVLQSSMNKKDMQPEDYNMLWLRHKTLYSKLIKQLEVFDKSIDEAADKATGKNNVNSTSLKDKVSAKAKDIKSGIDTKAENIKAKFKKESADEVDENAASVIGSLLPQGQGAYGVNDDTVEDMVDSDEDNFDQLERDIKESYDENIIYTTSMMCEAGGIKETADKIIQKIKSIGHGKDGEVRRNVIQKASKLQTSIILNQIRMKVEVAKDPKNGKNTATYKNALRETIRLEKDLRKVIEIMSDAEKSAFTAFCRELSKSSKETETAMVSDAKDARKSTITTNQGDGKKINKKLGIKTESVFDNIKKSSFDKICEHQLAIIALSNGVWKIFDELGYSERYGDRESLIKQHEDKIQKINDKLTPDEKKEFNKFKETALNIYNKYTKQAIRNVIKSEPYTEKEVKKAAEECDNKAKAELRKLYPGSKISLLKESADDKKTSGDSKLSKIYYAQLDLLEANQEVIVYKRAGIPDKIDKKSSENIKKIEEKIKTMKEGLNPAEKVAFTGFTSKAQGIYNKYTSQAVKEITNSEDADDAEATLIDIVDQENAEIAKMYPKYLEDYLEESVSDYYSEAANIDKEIQEYIDRLNDKGYKTLYSSPGHQNIKAKEDPNKDGVYYGKIYNDARIMFDDKYNFGVAPKYWYWRQVDGKSYLDIIPITFNRDKDSRDKQYAEWKKKYLKSLSDWIDELPDASDNGKKKDESDGSKGNTEDIDTTDKNDTTEEEVKDMEESVMSNLFASMGIIYG